MIRTEQLRKQFGSLEVLKGVNLSIEQGEIVSIIGKSGAGKSTLLHIIGTLDRATSGKVFFGQEEISAFPDKSLSAFRNKNIGFIFQFHNLLPEFSALENVMIPARIGGFPTDASTAKAKELLIFLGLGDRLTHKPNELSGGEQQRVSVARALINDPKLILADEPSGNLDTESSKQLHQLFFDLRDKLGKTFVIVTHNMELSEMADRSIRMQDGQIIS